MTINANPLNIRINSDSLCNLSELELLQVADAAGTLISSRVSTVATINDLPLAMNNTGRFIFVESIQDYRYSTGSNWIRDYNSQLEIITTPTFLVTWGNNSSGQLGDNTNIAKSSPVSVVGGFTDWCQVSAGGCHTAAIRTNGSLWAWGCNNSGRLGDNTTANRSSPVSIVFPIRISSSGFTAATLIDGSIWTWGRNSGGRLGDNTVVNKSSPVSVVGGFSDWCQVSAGRYNTAAIRTNCTLWTWGDNGLGQLGDNTIVNNSSPVSVVGGFTDWCQVSSGARHSVAIRTNGTLWTWGFNSYGRLGDNTVVNKSSPVSVIGGFLDWCQVSAGGEHTAAIRTNGSLWAWGNNSSGQLGDNTNIAKSSPVSVVGGFTNWCQVSAGAFHTAAVRATCSLWVWGSNNLGRLGDNTIVDKSSPVSVVGFADWCAVSSGVAHTIAIRTNCSIWTWGLNNVGQLGDNTIISKSSPVSVVGGLTDWCAVSGAFDHTIAIRTNGSIWSWGCNNSGQLGDNTIVDKSSPVSIIYTYPVWCQVSAGLLHTAAVKTNGILMTWGYNTCGRLGDNTTINKSSPIIVVGGFTNWCQVSAGVIHTAAVRKDGSLWTWGYNGSGRLGDDTLANKSSPVSVVGGFTDWCQVSAGNQHTAAVRTNGTLWNWGANFYGQLGDNTAVSKRSPVSVVGGFTDWCQVSSGQCHTAAVRTTGSLWAWGINTCGRLGDNTQVNRCSPVSVVGGFINWCQVAAGQYHTAAVRTNGSLWAWGRSNIYGQLGDNTTVNKFSPVSVVGGFLDWCQVSAGIQHTAAIRGATKTGF